MFGALLAEAYHPNKITDLTRFIDPFYSASIRLNQILTTKLHFTEVFLSSTNQSQH